MTYIILKTHFKKLHLFIFWLLLSTMYHQTFASEQNDYFASIPEDYTSCSASTADDLDNLSLNPDELAKLENWFDETINLDVFNLGLDIRTKRSASSQTEDYIKKLSGDFGLRLYGHQLAGISLLMDHQETLLADDMGLGKTVQSIYACMFDNRVKNVVVMVPPSLAKQWVRKANEWVAKLSPSFQARVFIRQLSQNRSNFAELLRVSGKNKKNVRESGTLDADASEATDKEVNFYFISANWLSAGIESAEKHQAILQLFQDIPSVDALIVDEVHKYSTGPAIKKAFASVFGLPENHPDAVDNLKPLRKKMDGMKVILLSGTPIRNSVFKELSFLGELLRVKDASLLRSKKRKRYDSNGDLFNTEKEKKVRDGILEKIIRRTKSGLIADKATLLSLPSIKYDDVQVKLDGISYNKYETLREATRLFVPEANRALSLNMTQILRQIAVSYNFLKPETRNKLGHKVETQWTGDQLNKILKEIGSGYGVDIDLEGNVRYECPICLEEQKAKCKLEGKPTPARLVELAPNNLLFLPCGHYHCRNCTERLTKMHNPRCSACKTAIPPKKSFFSAHEYQDLLRQEVAIPEDKSAGYVPPKFEQILIYLQETDDDKVLLFSEFKRPIKALEQLLEENGFSTVLVDKTIGDPMQQIAAFERDPSKKVCLLTYGYAEGHNISSANHVIFLTPPMSAHVYSQAVDRVYRLGQKKPVSIINLIAENTIDGIIYDRLRKNMKTIEDFYSLEVEVTDQSFEEANQKVRASVGEAVR